jgi:hypothetical protein
MLTVYFWLMFVKNGSYCTICQELLYYAYFHISYCVNRDTVGNSCDNTPEILHKLELSYDADDIAIMKYICETVSNRAALLVSICEFLLFIFLLIIVVAFSLPTEISAQIFLLYSLVVCYTSVPFP